MTAVVKEPVVTEAAVLKEMVALDQVMKDEECVVRWGGTWDADEIVVVVCEEERRSWLRRRRVGAGRLASPFGPWHCWRLAAARRNTVLSNADS